MDESAGIPIWAPLFRVELLTPPSFIGSFGIPNHDRRAHRWYLTLLSGLGALLVSCHNLLPVWRRLAELLNPMSKITVRDVWASPCTEFAAQLGLEEHFPPMALELVDLLLP